VGYNWVTGITNGPPDGNLSPQDIWITDDGSAALCLSVPAPGGEGDILERTEVAMDLCVGCGDSSILGFFINAAITQVAGDVGPIGGPPPDPASVGEYEFSFTTQLGWTEHIYPYDFLGSITPTFMRASTRGYITSKARRGPATYGSIDPAFNLGVVTRGWEYIFPIPGAVSFWWSITARTLWRTP
jgi:hypothetical protein